ncbi:hypothetical protein [Occallatibacter riparius]|uniref:Uncharacterized protein n=1 Tax=Occallatibacter riparius TaxID=1002689 RepID=A0A9J7BVD0_9BACT|nr:hypothetical protein [Occallatibacter riparius]UWZ86639.1 hypothetical protein MOP44_11995 [Occallatibacter riparius]
MEIAPNAAYSLGQLLLLIFVGLKMIYDRRYGVAKRKQRLKIGDWVRSKGGPIMTILEISAAGARCQWLNGRRLECGWFHPSELELSNASTELNQPTHRQIVPADSSLHSSRQHADSLCRTLPGMEKQYSNSIDPALFELRRIVLLQLAALRVDHRSNQGQTGDQERMG